ncbi:MAG: putative selenate reductase subunit YgfK [Firmicutes bacterium]|nr:putative selenate reductase subunit YgfK [Bacillota bacterium]
MNDRMTPLSFDRLMERVFREYREQGEILGVSPVYRAPQGGGMPFLGRRLETPLGPAAGPHSQMAPNLLAAYAAGARFFELKTVQVVDGADLPVEKPCILAEDEGYNVEWSTELTVEQALAEYVKAWYAMKLLSREWELGDAGGFLFNMSVGYDLAGITGPKITAFIDGLQNAGDLPVWRECEEWALSHLSRFERVDAAYVAAIDRQVCRSVTVSTLHGCPPQEIEAIAAYLLREKKLHTYVKLNPTLLGYDFVRDTLDRLGFDNIVLAEAAFAQDLRFDDAVPMLRRLLAAAGEQGLTFGAKLSNTLPTENRTRVLPGRDAYMSGRALFPLTAALAARLSQALAGALPISYCGGGELYNLVPLLQAGLAPVTLATPLLKPGGYSRLYQMALACEAAGHIPPSVDVRAAQALAEEAPKQEYYRKQPGERRPRKLAGPPPLAGCFAAPCQNNCPLEQDIPGYLQAMAAGDAAKALAIICRRNPLPFITGSICPHTCESGCNRRYLDRALAIRRLKLQAAEAGYDEFVRNLPPVRANGRKAAVIGGGPAGMAAAYFLAEAGFETHLFEKEAQLGGLIRQVIPGFRIDGRAIDRDAALLAARGVSVHTGSLAQDIASLLEQGFAPVMVAVGAPLAKPLALQRGQAMPALDMLRQYKQAPESLRLGRRVAVVGGGNTAIDAARAALRLPGVEQVTILYRRDAASMPAHGEEIAAALQEGVVIQEQVLPVGLENGMAHCEKMVLQPQKGGRPRPQPSGEYVDFPADTLIAALGQETDSRLYAALGVPLGADGLPAADENGRVAEDVYVIGDGAQGPGTATEAVASALRGVTAACGGAFAAGTGRTPVGAARGLRRERQADVREESARCWGCAGFCGLCAEVCPNRANVAVDTSIGRQIVHLDALCNACGNCAAFCPYEEAPYLHKFTVYANAEEFAAGENPGMCYDEDGGLLLRAAAQDRPAADAIASAIREKYPDLL